APAVIGAPNVGITDQPVGGLGLPPTEITITGLAPAPITYKADTAAGNFADGITVWTGSGNDTITVDGTHTRAGLRTITTLNTGEGNDRVTVSLDAATDGFFVVNTQGGDDTVNAAGATVPVPVGPGTSTLPASTLPLVIFGGLGRDTIDGGEGADIIFGDLGRVHYYIGSQLVT